MSQFSNYIIKEASSLEELQSLVNDWMGIGYQPIGSVTFITTGKIVEPLLYIQAMVR